MNRIIAFFCLLLTGSLLIGCGSKTEKVEGTIISEFDWNGKKHHITLEEMMQEISELPDYKQEQYRETKEGLEEYMTLMAESRLILMIAQDKNLQGNEEIQDKIQDYLHELMLEKITDIEVEQKIKLTEDNLRLYYEENKVEYIDPEQVRLTCITVKNEERANETFQQMADGADIKELAQTLSDRGELDGPGADPENPGDTGFISYSSFSDIVRPFVDAAFALEIDQTYDEVLRAEVRGEPYFMIFRKEEEKAERQKPFEEVRDSVESSAEQAKRDELLAGWLAGLREKAKVKVYEDLIRVPTELEAESTDSEDPTSEGTEDPTSEGTEDPTSEGTEDPTSRKNQTKKVRKNQTKNKKIRLTKPNNASTEYAKA